MKFTKPKQFKKLEHKEIYWNANHCIECNCKIEIKVREFSLNVIGIPLCRKCQNWLNELDETTTDRALSLYFALKARKVKAQLEKYDGFKKIDIAIPTAKINIEVDGKHHNTSTKQAFSDLQRTYYSFKKGYFTLRIPNSLLNDEEMTETTADYITDMIKT